MFGSADTFTRLIIYSDIPAEQALDAGVYTIRSCVDPGHLYNPVLIVNFQTRYFGLCSVMYVYAGCDRYQLIPDQFARTNTLCVFNP